MLVLKAYIYYQIFRRPFRSEKVEVNKVSGSSEELNRPRRGGTQATPHLESFNKLNSLPGKVNPEFKSHVPIKHFNLLFLSLHTNDS